MIAARNKSHETVNVLLQARADTNTVNSTGQTALVYSLQSTDNLAMVDRLCSLTTTTRGVEKAFYWIGRQRIKMSEPVKKFIRDSLRNTGRDIF